MIDTDKLDWEVIKDVALRLGWDDDEDNPIEPYIKRMQSMNRVEFLEAYLAWNGIIGYSEVIWNLTETLKAPYE